MVGNFLLLLKSNGIKTFLINDNNVIIKKLKYDLKMFKKYNRLQFSNELLVVLKVRVSKWERKKVSFK